MKRLAQFTLSAILVISAGVAVAHPVSGSDRDRDRNNRYDRNDDYRHDFDAGRYDNRRYIQPRKGHLRNQEYRRYRPRTERGRELYRQLVEERWDSRHPYTQDNRDKGRR